MRVGRLGVVIGWLLLGGCATQEEAGLRAYCERTTPGRCAWIGQGAPVRVPMWDGPGGPRGQTPNGTLHPTPFLGEYWVDGQPYGTVQTSPR